MTTAADKAIALGFTQDELIKLDPSEHGAVMATADRMDHFLRCPHLSSLGSPWGRGIFWGNSGLARLADIRGFLRGLLAAGDSKAARVAFGLFADLNKSLDYLAGYGGDVEGDHLSGRPFKNVRAWRVALSDDGTWGGFAIAWYRAIEKGQVFKARDAGSDEPQLLCYESGSPVDTIAYAPERDGHPAERVEFFYAYSFNGGLLYHGPGGDEVFSVDIGAASGRQTLWSVHT